MARPPRAFHSGRWLPTAPIDYSTCLLAATTQGTDWHGNRRRCSFWKQAGLLQIGTGSRSSNGNASTRAYYYDRLSIGTIAVIANDSSRDGASSISSRTMIADDGIGVARRRRSGDRFRIWIDDGMNRVCPAGAWSRVLALVRVFVVVLVLMFVGVHVPVITIMLGFVARRPNVGTKAGAERRTSHATAGIATLSEGPFRRGDQENRRRQHHGPARQIARSVKENHRSPFDCFADIESPGIALRHCTGQVYRTAPVLEPVSGQAARKGSKMLIAAVQTCHAQRWRFDGDEFIVAA
jgi:hypothetical protein